MIPRRTARGEIISPVAVSIICPESLSTDAPMTVADPLCGAGIILMTIHAPLPWPTPSKRRPTASWTARTSWTGCSALAVTDCSKESFILDLNRSWLRKRRRTAKLVIPSHLGRIISPRWWHGWIGSRGRIRKVRNRVLVGWIAIAINIQPPFCLAYPRLS